MRRKEEGEEREERKGNAEGRRSLCKNEYGNRDRGEWRGVQSRIQAQGEIGYPYLRHQNCGNYR